MTISVVIPVRNGAEQLKQCLTALQLSTITPSQVVVVDDASMDGSAAVAEAYGVLVIRNGVRLGSAWARNIGAQAACGEILLFIDCDVCVHPNTLERVYLGLTKDSHLAALFGSYDADPGASDFLSRYKNFHHHFVHQNGCVEASTFWSGCGAVRRDTFLTQGGFDARYSRPAVEDIEFGNRLNRAGYRIKLDTSVQVKHLKRWRFRHLIKTEIFDRAIPWTELVLRDGRIPNDLNLTTDQRVSAILVLISLGTLLVGTYLLGAPFLAPFLAAGFVLLGWSNGLARSAQTAVETSVCIGQTLVTMDPRRLYRPRWRCFCL